MSRQAALMLCIPVVPLFPMGTQPLHLPHGNQLSVPSSVDSDDTPGAICLCETHDARWDMQGGNDIKWSLN